MTDLSHTQVYIPGSSYVAVTRRLIMPFQAETRSGYKVLDSED